MQSAGIDAISQPVSATTGRSDSASVRRVIAVLAALASGVVLTIAAMLTPAEAGVGTHTQILPGQQCAWITAANCPCPTCGMTTAFAHAANGNLLASFLTQPLGSLLAIATAMTFLLSSYVAFTGSRVAHRLTRLWTPRMVWVVAALVLGSWFYKIVLYKGWL